MCQNVSKMYQKYVKNDTKGVKNVSKIIKNVPKCFKNVSKCIINFMTPVDGTVQNQAIIKHRTTRQAWPGGRSKAGQERIRSSAVVLIAFLTCPSLIRATRIKQPASKSAIPLHVY